MQCAPGLAPAAAVDEWAQQRLILLLHVQQLLLMRHLSTGHSSSGGGRNLDMHLHTTAKVTATAAVRQHQTGTRLFYVAEVNATVDN